MLLVLFLVGLLGYNNGLGDVIKEKLAKNILIEENMNLPGIISNEAQLGDKKEIQYEQVLVGNTYNIEAGLSLGSSGESVIELQKVLGNLQYFIGEVSGSFNEETRVALRETLIGECDWPESTSGVFGPQAKECIDNLEISLPNNIDIQEIPEEIISSEAEIGVVEDSDTGILVSEVYELQTGMALESTGTIVSDLQKVLQFLGYYNEDITEDFNESTRVALRETLIGECDWPESTSGIFGPQAKECIDALVIPN